jgi:hypothetical protein
MLQAVSLVTALAMAVPVSAGQATTVEIDFPGAAAVEAGMNDPKSVDPDPEGRRRATIVVPPGDSGTIYAMTRPDGTTVVRLVSDGQPAPSGFTRCGRYRAGDRLSFDVKTLTVTSAGTAAGGSGAAAEQTFNWTGFYVGINAGYGSGSLLDVVEENCGDFDQQLGLACDGDDRGPVWALGIDARYAFSRLFDAGFRAEYSKPEDITLNASGNVENIAITSMSRASGSLWNFSGQVGVSPASRLRLYGGFGATKFDVDLTSTFSAFNQTETQTDTATGWGRHAYGGAEYYFHPRFSIFGEGGRSWLKDESDDDDEDFEETYSRWMFGFRLELAKPRWRY